MPKEFFEEIFYSRNKKMAQGVLELLQKGKTPFIVVGAGHLIGEQSILQILQASGIQVEKLSAQYEAVSPDSNVSMEDTLSVDKSENCDPDRNCCQQDSDCVAMEKPPTMWQC